MPGKSKALVVYGKIKTRIDMETAKNQAKRDLNALVRNLKPLARAFGGVTVKGKDKTFRNLDRLAGREARKAQRNATRAAGKVVQKAAKDLVPVRTGLLKKEIKVRKQPGRMPDRFSYIVRVGASKKAFYGRFVERGRKGRKMRIKPFIAPAMDNNETIAMNTAIKSFWMKLKGLMRK